jgi:hypothetical protein
LINNLLSKISCVLISRSLLRNAGTQRWPCARGVSKCKSERELESRHNWVWDKTLPQQPNDWWTMENYMIFCSFWTWEKRALTDNFY